MTRLSSCAAILAAAIAFGGCSFVSDTVFPSLSGENPANAKQSTQRIEIPPGPAEMAGAPPALGTSSFEPGSVTSGSSTGTEVGRKIQQLREDLRRLQAGVAQYNGELQGIRGQTVQNAQRYHGTVAAINARLQVGTTPGNPILTTQWNTAQQQLDAISSEIARMNTLANRVASDSSTAAYLLETTRALYGLSGAVEEDHRQLSILEDEVNRTVVLVDRLLNELNDDVTRQTNYLINERRNLTTLALAIKNGEMLGSNLSNRAYDSSVPVAGPSNRGPLASTPMDLAARRPLVVIRFDRPDVEYQQALYTAVNRALERRPNAMFDVVAVAPSRGSPAQAAATTSTARRNAENVLRSLNNMGLPASRVSMSATNSAEAATPEVHIYVR
jgi:TolA-binding protein